MKTKTKLHPSLPQYASLRQFLAYHISLSGLTNREIAAACGLRAVNMVTMIKRGHSRLPLDRLGVMSRVLGIDAYDLFDRWMREYYVETWREVSALISRRPGRVA